MKRSSSSTSSMSSTYSSDSKAFGAPNRQADLPISRIHGHHRSEGNALLRPPSRAEANHRRIVSMPDTSNHGPHRPVDWNYSSSDGSAERNFGTGSPPIFDFTTFEDRYRNSSSTGLHNSFLVVTPSSKDGRRVVSDQGIGIKRQSAGDSSIAPTSTSWPDFDMILETLEDIIAEDSVRWNFDLEELIDNRHQQELRDNLPVKASRKLTVFSRPLSEVVQYASKAIFFGNGRTGTSLSLPLVIISCVEELYRTGIYQPNLFRTLPNRSRLLDLISIFDSMDRAPSIKCNTRQKSSTQEEFGANVSLQLEATADICALFTSYLSALPESLVPAHIFDAIWVLCDLEVTPSISKDPSFEIDATRQTPSILLAQLLLHLLPPPNFSLLVYLLAFFSQTVLANEENGVDIRDLVKMFGARLFGNGVSPVAPSSHSMPNSKGNSQDPLPTSPARGEIMMAWFLRRWATIIDSLFEVVEDAKMGVYRRNKRLRKDSLGRPTLQRRREKTLKSCSRLAKVLSEGDTTAGTPKKQSKTRLQPQKAMTLDGPSLQASLSAFKFPVAALPHLRSEAKIISPTTVVVPQSGLYSIGTGLNLQSKAANEGPGHRAQLKTPRVAPSRFRSELKGSAQPPSLHSDSQYRLPDDDYFS
ncbi:Rho GTPase activation protein [Crepidotus variabilis]|uniref:Rho GTPase activation protein n=1 Tax=Crepidotus variabilis TaxID=179855 RepID=A0A9P6JPY4_9AGAR|nr:Rho GTPase activation protein [Crepidotus variabilis]